MKCIVVGCYSMVPLPPGLDDEDNNGVKVVIAPSTVAPGLRS